MHKEHLYSFTEHLKVLNRTPATIDSYCDNVRCYLESLGKDIKAVTASDMEGYVSGLFAYRDKENKKYATNTVIVKVRALKRFFEFLETKNIIFINPMERILEPQKEKRLPRAILTTREVQKILEQPNLGTPTGIRDRTVLELFYSTGIRLNELVSLTVYDADLQGGLLRINQGKGRKDRVVPMGRHAVRFLREYIAKVRSRYSKKNPRDRSLLVDYHGKQVSKEVVTILVRSYARKAGIGKKVSAHTFRHTFATELIKNGADIVAVQKMLGHVDIKTTQGYIRALGLDLKKAHTKSHPREKDKVQPGDVKPKIERIREKYAQRQPRTPE
jgi:integrase/recombinase XerD